MASLFEGTPQNATSYVESTSEYPKWMQDAIYNQITWAQNLAQTPYTPYEMPQVAELSPLEQQAYESVSGQQGAYTPTVQGAITGTQGIAGTNSVSNIQTYMNPYQQNVLDVIAQQGSRNLTENLLPGVSDAFIKAGQFGSSQMGEFGSRAVRDTQEAIIQQQAQAAQQGYTEALGASQTDRAQQLAAQQQAASLAQTGQQMGYTDTAALEAAGQGQRAVAQAQLDAAKQQYETEQLYPWQQLSYANEAIRGLSSSVPQTSSQATTSSGQTYSASPLSQLASGFGTAAGLSKLLGS